LYHLYGIEKALSKLKGMFAFVIHDTRNNKVVIATDRFKIKPLYSYYKDDTLWIFSEPRAMEGLIEFQVEYKGFYSWLVYDGSIDSTTNFFRDIKGVPAASYCEIDAPCDPTYTEYYRIQNKGDTTLQKDEIIDKLKFLFENSVIQHTSSDYPLSVMLSGGIDSNAIEYFLHKHNKNITNYTGLYENFNSFEGDETHITKQISSLHNVPYEEIKITNNDFVDNVHNFVISQNYPKQGPAVFSRYMLFKGIKNKHKIAFSGNGADEMFCGYPWFIQEALYRKKIGLPSQTIFADNVLYYLDNLKGFGWVNNINITKQQYFEQWHLFKSRYTKPHDCFNYQIFENIKDYCSFKLEPEFNDIRDSTIQGVRTWKRSLLSSEDCAAMAHGVENRLPFLDHELVDFVYTIPEHLLIPNGFMKGIFVEAMLDELPTAVIKQYFSRYNPRNQKNVFIAPLTNWFVKDPKIKQFAYDILNSQKAKNRDYRIKQDVTSEIAPPAIWRLLVLELWHQHFIDRV